MASEYARVFDSETLFWQKSPEMNRIFIQMQQHHWNQRLRSMGHVFLNEVYDSLGFPRTTKGAITGWLADDNAYIEFEMNEADDAIQLDFNVQGVIYEKIEGP